MSSIGFFLRQLELEMGLKALKVSLVVEQLRGLRALKV
jgi:hypothetical protein